MPTNNYNYVPTLTPTDVLLNRLAIILVLFMWIFTACIYSTLPQTIPVHFNAHGNPDDFGSKATLLLLPIIATLIFTGLTTLNKYPHRFNYMVTITEQNAQQQYSAATRLMRYVKLAVVAVFSYILVFTYLNIKGIVHGLGGWFLPIVVAAFCIPIGISIWYTKKQQ